jgi:hypothetical protein
MVRIRPLFVSRAHVPSHQSAEYRTTLPHERLLAEEIARTGRQLDLHRQKEFRALSRRRRARPSRSRRAFRQGHHLIAGGDRRLGGRQKLPPPREPLSPAGTLIHGLPPQTTPTRGNGPCRPWRVAASAALPVYEACGRVACARCAFFRATPRERMNQLNLRTEA